MFHKKAKTTKKVVLRLECTVCKTKAQLALKRCKHFELGWVDQVLIEEGKGAQRANSWCTVGTRRRRALRWYSRGETSCGGCLFCSGHEGVIGRESTMETLCIISNRLLRFSPCRRTIHRRQSCPCVRALSAWFSTWQATKYL